MSLQEANAFAILDLDQLVVSALVGLRFKDHLLPGNELDASDQSGSIQLLSWPVFGMYQPGGIDAFATGGEVWSATANEGDARAYSGFNEERRVNQLDLDNAAFPNEAVLKQNTNLGRLRVTGATGDPDHDNDFDELYAFGARSFSIRDSSGALAWDSGDELEQITAAWRSTT